MDTPYMRLPYHLLEWWLKEPLTRSQLAILLWVQRMTEGYHREWAVISISDFTRKVGASRRPVISALEKLLQQGYLVRVPSGKGYAYKIGAAGSTGNGAADSTPDSVVNSTDNGVADSTPIKESSKDNNPSPPFRSQKHLMNLWMCYFPSERVGSSACREMLVNLYQQGYDPRDMEEEILAASGEKARSLSPFELKRRLERRHRTHGNHQTAKPDPQIAGRNGTKRPGDFFRNLPGLS